MISPKTRAGIDAKNTPNCRFGVSLTAPDYMSLGVNIFYFSLPGHCSFELGFGCMVLGR